MFLSLKLFALAEPESGGSVGRHAPVSAGRETDRSDFRPVGQTRPLELLGEEAPEEHRYPVFDHCAVVGSLKRDDGETEDAPRREAVAKSIIQEKVMKFIRADEIFSLLFDCAVGCRRNKLGTDWRVYNVK